MSYLKKFVACHVGGGKIEVEKIRSEQQLDEDDVVFNKVNEAKQRR